MCTIFALAELSVTYPVNGAFFDYTVRFIDPSWFVNALLLLLAILIVVHRGFAQGWLYAVGWLLSLPNELSAAGVTITYWRPDLNNGIWVAAFLVALALVQLFGVRGYGEGKLGTDIAKLPMLTDGISRVHSFDH